MEDFFKPKIIYPNMTKFMPFVYENKGFVTNQKCFIITGNNIAYLTAFFNSSLFKFCFIDNFPKLGDSGRELSKIFFEKIPVLNVSYSQDEEFRAVIESIQQEYTQQKVIKIDEMIFDLYNLTLEERQVIGYIEIQ